MTRELNRGGARDNARLSLFGQPRPGREESVPEPGPVVDPVERAQGRQSIGAPKRLHVESQPRHCPSRRHEVGPRRRGARGPPEREGSPSAWSAWTAGASTFDLEILLRTIHLVLRRQGISGEGEATMSVFTSPHGDRALNGVA